jgi:PAS domain S-box-containing protein
MNGLTDLPRKRTLLMVRGVLTLTVAILTITAPRGAETTQAISILGAFIVSLAALALLPPEILKAPRFDLGIVLVDTLFLGASLYYCTSGDPGAFLAFFVVVLLVAVAGDLARSVLAATVATFLYAWFSPLGVEEVLTPGFLMRIPFFYMVAIYYGTFVALAVDRQRQASQNDEERDHLRAVLGVMEATTNSLDIHHVLYETTSRIARHVSSNRTSVLLIDPREGPNRAFVLASSDDPLVDMLPIDLRLYPEVRQAVETRQPVILPNILEADVMVEVRDNVRHLAFRSLLVVPMLHSDEVVGTMILRAAGTRAFTPQQVRFARVVASASTNAVKNALLFRESERRSREHQHTSQKLQRVLDSSPDLILTTDGDGSITEFNLGGQKILGFHRDQLIGRPLASVFSRSPEFAEMWVRAVREGMPAEMTVGLRKQDGESKQVSLSFSAILDAAGRAVGLAAVGRDVTEVRKAQEQILSAYRLSSMGEVIAGVAHELNNPLSSVIGYSQLLMAKDQTAVQDTRMLKTIHDEAWRCQRVVRNLLSFASQQPSEKKFLGINGILDKVIDLKSYQLQADGITLDREYEPNLACTMIDFHAMEQVFMNLLNNAQQALLGIPKGRRIVVRTANDADRIRVEVVDNGPGMAPEVVARIFDPFFTTKRAGEGTGLGLSVSFGIVREHSGLIRVQSAPGLGATFTVELPVIAGVAEDEPAEEALPVEATIADGKRILVVDDEPAILDLFIDILERFPVRVDTAQNGMEAMRKIQDGKYDLVISDLKMPEMDGPSFYREVVRRRPDLTGRMVFTTGDLAGSASSEFLEQARLPVIRKPIDIRQVVEIVTQATSIN